MNEITEMPPSYDYGHDFNYSQWTAGTEVLLTNVPWNSSYRDIVKFPDQGQLNQYLDNLAGPSIRVPKVTYHRPHLPIRLNIPFGKAYHYNYLRASNPAQPGQSGDYAKSFYYFIVDIRHINPGTTEFLLQLDVWQTFGKDVTFGNCYIDTGHIGIANENSFRNYGRDYLTIPEGTDIGGEYQINRVYSHEIASARTNGEGYSILVTSTVALDEDPGTVDAPKLKSATGSGLQNLPNGAEVYVFASHAVFRAFLDKYKDKPWITQGIISVTAIPPASAQAYGMRRKVKNVDGMIIFEVEDGPLKRVKTKMGEKWRDGVRATIPQRYRHLDKFLTYPYTVLELTANTGTPLVLKPESWPSDDMEIIEVPHFAQPNPRIVFYPFRYNAHTQAVSEDANGVVHDGGEFLDMATGIFNFPTFSLVNNSYLSFMASQSNSIAFQHQSADWSQSRALAGNELSANQATAGIGLSQTQTQIGIDTARQQTTLSNETQVLSGALGAANSMIGGRGGLGIANAGANAAIGVYANEQGNAIGAGAARRSNAALTGNMGYVRDSNKDYADMAARGDYRTNISGINAKVQDAKMIQPTTSGQVGGDAFLLASYRWGYDVKVKTVQASAMRTQGEQWLRYGYPVRQFSTPPASLMVMNKFTYWKLIETYIYSSVCPESYKETIRGIFEKGVTVWQRPEDIGRIDIADNLPLPGVTL